MTTYNQIVTLLKTQIIMLLANSCKLKTSNCNKTQNHKLSQYLKTQLVRRRKNLNYYKFLTFQNQLMREKNHNLTKMKNKSYYDKTQIKTNPKTQKLKF